MFLQEPRGSCPCSEECEVDATKKKEFIESLCNSIRDHLVAQVPRMPAEWDGYELRELLVDTFERERMPRKTFGHRRLREYRSQCYNNNLG